MTIRIAVTPGEPAGIGPDLCVRVAQRPREAFQLVVFADPTLLESRAAQIKLPLKLIEWNPSAEKTAKAGELHFIPIRLSEGVKTGTLNSANSSYVLNTLNAAVDSVIGKDLDGLVTGPVHKGVINQAGIPFTGHTEFLAQRCKQQLTVMMLATAGLRVALATTHLPLAAVPKTITKTLLSKVITILNNDLKNKFGIKDPHILVCGLNPHAGEDGYIGREEIEVIKPVIEEFQNQGRMLTGPLAADTLFTPKYLNSAHAVLAMFHDQGLPVLKYKGFGNSCNITLGLPIVRTSVDHGTALDLAGTNEINCGSIEYAIKTAAEMLSMRDAR
jgi:4-hydroxythreonine-4-phosphate dehydrogenase